MIDKKRPRRRKPRLNQKRPSNHLRSFDNNRSVNVPRSRGALAKALEKYNGLAQDAVSNGDRIVAENYYQYAEHYQRVLNEIGDDAKTTSLEPKGKPFGSPVNEHENKPSRTQRAIEAKNEKFEKSNNHDVGINEVSNTSKDVEGNEKKSKTYTSDGLEALKPFEI